jgi:pseudaminic acid cytidylyltransferase
MRPDEERMKSIAVIPARGGSKRIPHKNIKLFAGKPIIGYSIETALRSKLFDRVIVSTDDEDIAKIAKYFGAEVPFFRPIDLADDFTGTNDVVKHCLCWLRDTEECAIDLVCCIYATAPFLNEYYLCQGKSILQTTGRSFAFSVTSFVFPVQRALLLNKDGYIEAMYPENIAVRSQDLEPAYHDAGQFYWGTAEAFLQNKIMYSPASAPVILPRYLVQDIDTEEDWHQAELMFKVISSRKP